MIDTHIFTQFEKIIVDLGCGDGKQIYRMASKSPSNLFIGIDSNAAGYMEIEKKTNKKPHKGGLSNLVFIQAKAEELPKELTNLVDEIYIHFPWGSLLEGLVKADQLLLAQLRNCMKNGAELTIMLTYDDKYEESYRSERRLPNLDLSFIQSELALQFKEKGFYLLYSYALLPEEKRNIDSPWGKKILNSRDREVFGLQFKLTK